MQLEYEIMYLLLHVFCECISVMSHYATINISQSEKFVAPDVTFYR